MNYIDIKQAEQEKITELSHEVGLFWAFSDKQFEESKTPKKRGSKYASIGGGGYLPNYNVSVFTKGMDNIRDWKRAEVKKNKAEQERVILYELNNHECFYTGDIIDAMPVLKDLGFSQKQVYKVYNARRAEAQEVMA
jgi:hypothetical protein